MKPGDLAECAIWLDGTETEAHLKLWKADCGYMMANAHQPVLKLGPVSFELKRPGDDRVPQVPDHVSGPDVRLLVGSAVVLGFEMPKASFLSELSDSDLYRLRKATRRAHKKPLPDSVCDQLIERMGPLAAGMALH